MYYLAYGSNLNIAQMHDRCPKAKKAGKSLIYDYELLFRKYLTITPKLNAIVPVGVWEITEECEARLDYFEHYPHSYKKEYFEVELNGEIIKALVYIMNDIRAIMPPEADYYNRVKVGYQNFLLPEHYLLTAYKNSQ